MQADSVDKIVLRYFASVAREAFVFKKVQHEPKALYISPLLLRGYTCPPMCGGCCLKFTLDYIPSESKPPGVTRRTVIFNEKPVEIWTDAQESNTDTRCQHLVRENGRCGIYQRRPFSCDFELIRTLQFESRPNILTQKLFGRGWSYPRVDGGKGALCTMTDPTAETVADVVRKLHRLQAWTDHFGLRTWLPAIIEHIEKGRLTSQVKFDPVVTGFGL